MSIDNCQRCDKRLDTDFVEYQPDGSLYCGACEADIEEEKHQEPDWKALAGELAEAVGFALEDVCGAKLCHINSMSSRMEMERLMERAAYTLRAARKLHEDAK